MPYGLYISAEGAQAQGRRLETIANNMANVDTAGFKRDLALFQARYAEEVSQGRDYYGSGSINNVGGGVEQIGTRIDFSPGPLARTGMPQDMAIRGDGFFVVQHGKDKLLTRAGNFQFNATGGLITQDGDPVIGDDGAPIELDPELPWTLTADGGLQQGNDITYLALVKPPTPDDLAKVGGNLFQPLARTRPLEPEERQVVSGFLEKSGANPTTEMMGMIEASRAFEANVNLIRNQDQMLGSLVTRLLRAS
jgi:flagellar basal-body rod protein FlgF